MIEVLDATPGWGREIRSADDSLTLSMPKGSYGWISLDRRGVGFDFYFDAGAPDLCRAILLEDAAPKAAGRPEFAGFPFSAAAEVGWHWNMRLQGSQPLAARLLAGFAAAALAELTGGIVWSSDGGADWSRMPALPQVFLDWYPGWISGTTTA